MKQELVNIINSKNGPFFFTVGSIVILYGIQRITEKDYQITASTRNGESVTLKPNTNNVDEVNQENETEEEGGEA